MTTTALSNRLTDARERKGELRDKLRAARDEQAATRDAVLRSGNDPRDPSALRAAELARDNVTRLAHELELADEEERYLLADAAGINGSGVYGGGSFMRNSETLSNLAQLADSTAPIGRVNLGTLADRDTVANFTGRAITLAAGEATPTDRSRDAPHRGIVPQLDRPLSFLDLLASEPMDGRSAPYLREMGSADGAAATVAEGAVKPAATIDFADAEAIARTIAHYTKINRQALADVVQLDAVLRNRLTFGVLRQLEAQVIGGDGAGTNLRGVLNTTGIAAPDVTAMDLAADKALEGLISVMVAGAVPNVIALHPRDWAAMLTAKATGSGEYLSAGPFVDTARRLWGTTVVPSIGVPLGEALVGDTQLGATLLVREAINVTISDSDSDDFIRNRVTLLAEGRWALAVWLPAAWARVSLAA